MCKTSFFHVFNNLARKKLEKSKLTFYWKYICLHKNTVVSRTQQSWLNSGDDSSGCLTRWSDDLLTDRPTARLRPQHPCSGDNSTEEQETISDHNDCSACHFLPRAHMHTAPGGGHDLEVSLYWFIVSLQSRFLPHCIPTEPLIWAFIKWVHRHSAGAPALVSHRPSAGNKSSIYLCYEGHVERTMGVALRDALRDNCLTMLKDLW